MTDFSPTEEQLAILDAVKGSNRNLLIKALAGAAKTSTLVLIARATQSIPTVALSFNVAIAKEMKERLPGNCESLTLNGMGHRAWIKSIGRRVAVNRDKTYDQLRLAIDGLSREDKSKAYEQTSVILQSIRQGKSSGYIPDNNPFLSNMNRLVDDEAFFEGLDEEPSGLVIDLIRTVSNKSVQLGVNGEIDFDDQILLPTVFHHGQFTSYPQVLLDEGQDTSELNHAMLKKIIGVNRQSGASRFIGVGDECQAIYGFRGAHATSMDLLEKTFDMDPLVLSVSFRCPTKIVEAARWRAPHMKWPAWAKEGTVKTLYAWSEKDLPENAVILCRNNAPLFSMALALIRNGRYPEIVGSDIGKKLIKTMSDLGHPGLERESVLAAIARWADEKMAKSRNKGAIQDQAECMKVFAFAGKNLGDALAYAEAIFRQTGPIKLMTIHKSKGLEFPNVFILDQHLLDVKNQGSQDRNLLYVAQTRAKETLTYIESERFTDNV